MSKCKFIDEIRKLDIPSKCKAELLMLYSKCRRLALAIIKFLMTHKRFGEAVILGCIVAFLLTRIPWIGGFLALCALVTAAAMGLMRELREDLTKFFDAEVPAQA
jgi:hypothetical protein